MDRNEDTGSFVGTSLKQSINQQFDVSEKTETPLADSFEKLGKSMTKLMCTMMTINNETSIPGYNQPQFVKDALVKSTSNLLPEKECNDWVELFEAKLPDDFFEGKSDTTFLDRGKQMNPKYELERFFENSGWAPWDDLWQTHYTRLAKMGEAGAKFRYRIKPQQ